MLRDDLGVFSAFGSHCSAIVNLVFAGDGGWFVVADVAVKNFEFRVVVVYAPNSIGERRSFFRQLEPFLDDRKRIILVGDWNTILDPKIDKAGRGISGSDRCESCLIDLMARYDLVDRFRVDHSGREMWTWLDISPSVRVRTYLDRAD